MQTYIDKFNNQALKIAEARKKAIYILLKARNPNLYYSNLHIECYYFASSVKTILKL